MQQQPRTLRIKRLGIDTYNEPVIYMRRDCHICLSEGFEVHARVKVTVGEHSIIATLHIMEDTILQQGEVGLSNYAWRLLGTKDGDEAEFSHAKPLTSLSYVRAKIYGHELEENELHSIIEDVASGRYSDIHNATFLTACAGGKLNEREISYLTKAMIAAGDQLHWPMDMVVDKHSVGGLPGNRTSLIIVPIVASFGLTMPKTSSRAITSPAGTADTMEVFAPVELSLTKMHQVVEQEQGCIIWGGSVYLSPADDILIRVEKAMDLDSEGQLVASVISKKVAVGSSHIVIDMPVGPTAKIRSTAMAMMLKGYLESVAKALNVHIQIVFSDGTQPVGYGIGPALEAKDVMAVLKNEAEAPPDLREHALVLAGNILEFSPHVKKGSGFQLADEILSSGAAWKKFQAICEAQGGMNEPQTAPHCYDITAHQDGQVSAIDNRRLARIAKLAGAPTNKTAGIKIHARIKTKVNKGQPLYTLYAETKSELEYALTLLAHDNHIFQIEEV